MSLDKDTVKKIAYLARIRLADDALDGLADELSNIIGWVEQLAEVDTDGVAPMTSVADMSWPRRDDAITDGNKTEDVLLNAPDPETAPEDSSGGGFYTVPKVLE